MEGLPEWLQAHPEVRLPDRGGNPAAVACGDCLRMAVGRTRPGSWEGILAGYAG